MTMSTTQVTFDLPDTRREVEFLQEYMIPAWERFHASDAFESGYFWRAGNFPHNDLVDVEREKHELERLEPGMIIFLINGSPDEIVETEREYWEEFEAAGLLDGWETHSFEPRVENALAKMRDKYGEEGGDIAYRLRGIAADTTVDLLSEFEQPLPAVGESTEENPVPIGFWTIIHFLMKHQGYDWYQEIDACKTAIKGRVMSLSTFTSDEEARAKLDAVIEELETFRSEFEG